MAHKTETQPSVFSDDQRDYWECLGRFVDLFSLVENHMQIALRRFSGVQASIAPCIFSGTRIEVATSQIKRIAEVKDWPRDRRAKFDTIADQVGEITRMRNDLLHYSAMDNGNHRTMSNALYTHTASRMRSAVVTPAILEQMSQDLLTIGAQLILLYENHRKLPPGFVELQMPPQSAWLYRPVRLQGPPRRSRRPHQKRQGRPPASRV